MLMQNKCHTKNKSCMHITYNAHKQTKFQDRISGALQSHIEFLQLWFLLLFTVF